MYLGKCHCGNVEINIPKITDTVTSCNCSLCSRYSSLWAYYTDAEVEISVGEHGLSAYHWGDKCIDFQRCNYCGCVTHYTSTDKAKSDRVAVNFRMFEPSVQKFPRIRCFDGADTWVYIGK